MAGRLRFEAWTLPTTSPFEKICDIPALAGSTGTRELSAYADGTLRVPAFWDGFDLIVSDTIGSLIRVYDGTTIVDEFLAERVDSPIDRPGERTISGTQINGLIERLAVYPYNYPNDSAASQDWVWGGENILPDLALVDLGSIREVWELWNTGTGTSFTLTVDGQTTIGISYTTTSFFLEQRLQDLSTVNDVTVAGGGTSVDDPWTITFYDPPDPTTVSVADTGGSSTLTKITEGAFDYSPITQVQAADARIDPAVVGGYADPPLEVVTTNLNTGSDWAMLVNAVGQFAGAQVLLSVKPGGTYSNISIPIRPTASGKYRLVVRDIYENLIAGTDPWEVSLTANTYQTLLIPGPITIPAGVDIVIFRVAVVQPTYADFQIDWQHATMNEGLPEATPGEIVRVLVENGQDERTAFTFLDLSTFSDTTDSNGTAWPSSLSFTAWFGSNMSHVLGDFNDLQYPWGIYPKATPSGGLTHELRFYVDDTIEDLTSSAGGPSLVSGAVTGANVVKRVPRYTAAAAWGLEGLYLEDTDATRLTNFGRWETVFDVEHLASTAALQELLDAQFAEQATNLTATQAVVSGDDTQTPLVDYDVGSKVWWSFPGILTKQARTVRRISWTHAAISNDLAEYTLHASTVFTGEAGMAAAVNKLLQKYDRRRRSQKAGVSLGGGVGVPLVVAATDSSAYWKDVADFVCTDGNGLDHETIQTALDAAGQWGWVLLAPGYYSCTVPDGGTALTVPFGCRFTGTGPLPYLATQLAVDYFTGTTGYVLTCSGENALEDFMIQTLYVGPRGIKFADNGGFSRIKGLWVETEGRAAIYGRALKMTHIDNNYFDVQFNDVTDEPAIIIEGQGFNENWIHQNQFEGGGILCLGSATWGSTGRISITNNTFGGITGWAIDLDDSPTTLAQPTEFTITGNRVIGTGFGNGWEGSVRLIGNGTTLATQPVDIEGVISDNAFGDTPGGLHFIGVSGYMVHDNVLDRYGQAFETPNTHGITLDNSSEMQIHHNLFGPHDPGNDIIDAIRITNNSDRNRIESNTFRYYVNTNPTIVGAPKYCINVASSDCDDNLLWFNDARLGYITAAINDAGTGTSFEPPTGGSIGSNLN